MVAAAAALFEPADPWACGPDRRGIEPESGRFRITIGPGVVRLSWTNPVNAALEWLMDEGYVHGTGTMQRIVLRPRLTPYGEKYAASGKSVRDLPGITEVQNPYLHIEGNSGVAIAFNSPGAVQTVTVQQTVEHAHNLADAIEQALPAVTEAEVRTHAKELVSEIRRESNSDSPSPGRLKSLATTAMTAIATAAGTEAGKTIIEAALPLMS
jgi:hypothetical protein